MKPVEPKHNQIVIRALTFYRERLLEQGLKANEAGNLRAVEQKGREYEDAGDIETAMLEKKVELMEHV